MRIVHISDLHFGKEDPEVTAALLADIALQRPELVIVSGDLTQRARVSEFAAAADFLQAIHGAKLIIPGNHDIPLDTFWLRLRAWRRYQRWITHDLMPEYVNDSMAILGLNTAVPWLWKNGAVGSSQLQAIAEFFIQHQHLPYRMIVSHHPLLFEIGTQHHTRVKRQLRSLLAQLNINVLLAGHLHQSQALGVKMLHLDQSHLCFSIQAGTAISRRLREAVNAYQCLDFGPHGLEAHLRVYQTDRFIHSETRRLDAEPGLLTSCLP